jgi:sialic acid synthase SpsE
MSQIILDAGSGNTCKNDIGYIEKMIDEVKAVDTGKHEIIFKWQLFQKAGANVPLKLACFRHAYEYAEDLGYKTTASVFDMDSLKYLLSYNVPFIKIANNRKLDWLIGEIPRKVPVYVSIGSELEYNCITTDLEIISLLCISRYPAEIQDYEKLYKRLLMYDLNLNMFVKNPNPRKGMGISDHIIGLDLFKKYNPAIWEKHLKLPDSIGLDAGEFAITPEELREIL